MRAYTCTRVALPLVGCGGLLERRHPGRDPAATYNILRIYQATKQATLVPPIKSRPEQITVHSGHAIQYITRTAGHQHSGSGGVGERLVHHVPSERGTSSSSCCPW